MRIASLILIVGAALGCADEEGYDKLELIDVTGKVTLDGAPLTGARIVFEALDKSGAEGITDAEGKYRLMYDAQHPGCQAGLKTVRITTAALVDEGADPDNPMAGEKIPEQYNRASRLTADISSNNRSFVFDLKSSP